MYFLVVAGIFIVIFVFANFQKEIDYKKFKNFMRESVRKEARFISEISSYK